MQARHILTILVVLAAGHAVQASISMSDPKPQVSLVDSAPETKPPLDPKSDKKFFGPPFPADYPDDHTPPVYHKFEHPFPSVQESSAYDTDYPKDENSDSGEWGAQMEYDRLKNKVMKLKDALHGAEEHEAAEEKDVHDAEDEEKKAEDEADGTGHARADKEKDGRDADEKLHDNTNDVHGASDDLADELKDIEDCKRELEKANAKLRALINEAQAAKQSAALAQEDERVADEETAALEKKVAALKKTLDEKKATAKEAHEELDEETESMEDLKARLSKAEAKLKKFRGEKAKAEDTEHDGCSHLALPYLVLLGASLLIFGN